LKQILSNEKQLLLLEEVKFIRVPKYEELSVKALCPQAIADDKVKRFLPDSTQKSKPLDRQFFFNILNSVYP
jgi:hypothetical protein